MPLAERDSNGSGRNSRASNMSQGSRGHPPKGPPPTRNDLFSSAPGVASMLRTSTELGNLGGIAYDASSNMPNVPRAAPRSGAASRMSTGSSHSNNSRRDSRPRSAQHHAWPSGSSGPRHSMTRHGNMPDYIADTLSPTIMNLPGSSPLIPHSNSSRDGRSRSMTNAIQPHMSLTSNRSYSSLRTQDLTQRPRSPFDAYPQQQYRRPGGIPQMRSVSPAVSDYTDSRPRRWHGDRPYPPPRVQSDMSVRRGHRGQMQMQMGQMGPMMPPHRTRSPAYYANPNHHQGIPPVPQIPSHHRHRAVSHARATQNQARGSSSSGFTNRRADSEAPSSDEPSPPTPKDGPLMGTLVSPTGAHVLIDPSVGDYYDGTEEYYDHEEYLVTQPDTVLTGYNSGIKTILEAVETSHDTNGATIQEEEVDPELEGRAELPASPVARRITRDLVLAALNDPASSTDHAASSTDLPEIKLPGSKSKDDGRDKGKEEMVTGAHMDGANDLSIISHAATSLMESSTVELAIRYTSPGGAGHVPSENVTSSDGMSDLLDGYQHTEIKEDSEVVDSGRSWKVVSGEELDDRLQEAKKQEVARQDADKKSNHTPKSSDQQSFKSCTDLTEMPCKDSDARSFRTAKLAVTPDRAVSMPASRLPSSNMAILGKSEPQLSRPTSEMPLSSPPTVLRKKHHADLRESSFHKVGSRIRANSKMSSRNASTVTSINSSVDIGIQQQPIVPRRESSSSKEAQRTTAVASYLLRSFRPGGRFNKRSNRSGDSPQPSISEDMTPEEAGVKKQEASAPGRLSMHRLEQGVEDPDKLSANQGVAFEDRAGAPSKDSGGLKAGSPGGISRSPAVTPIRHRALSTPSAVIPAPSSVYSSDNISSSFKGRTQSSPPDLSKSPEDSGSRRDSQSTTHLVWPRRSLHVRSTTTPERPVTSSDNDDTTTALRLSSYRHPLALQMHYLPDLKEESHEDSSLNTSASNLKNSTFRFPPGGQLSLRPSAEDGLLFGRNASIKSIRNSVVSQTRGRLPSMNFSRMDLVSNLDDLFAPRTTRSFDADDREEVHRVLARSTSDGVIREKYKSVFAGLEGSEKTANGAQTTMDLSAIKRHYSARDYMADINNVSVPSVKGLTMRISEFFPTLRDGAARGAQGEFVVEEEPIVENVREKLQEVCPPAQKRSSARLRPMPGSPSLQLMDDAVYQELTGREKEVAGGDTETGTSSRRATTSGVVNGGARDKVTLAELEAPCTARLRPRSLSLGERPSSRQSIRRSQLSLPSTPTASTDSHPWHIDGNFPWAESAIPSVDISLPAPAALKSSPRHGPSPLRLRLSQSSETGISPSNNTRASGGLKQLVEDSSNPRNSRLLGPGRDLNSSNPSPPGSFDNHGFLIGPIDLRSGDQSHEAGDRYPTSSLSPPSNVNLHNLTQQPPTRLSDSDDELASPRRRKLSLLPRFTSARTPVALSTESRGLAASASDAHRRNQGERRRSAQPFAHHTRRNTYSNASGLTAQQYHMAKLTDNIKEKWGRFKKRCGRIFKRDPGVQEMIDYRPAEPSRSALDDSHIPADVLEHRARMPDSYYDMSSTPPAAPRRWKLFPTK